MHRERNGAARGLSISLLSILTALGLTVALYPRVVPLPSPLFFAAILVSAWFGGRGPGILATALSAAALASYVLPYQVQISDPLTIVGGTIVYAGIGFAITYLAEAFKRGEARFRQALESIPEAILIVLRDKLVYANQAAATLLGAASSQQLIGRALADFVGGKEDASPGQCPNGAAGSRRLPPSRQTWIRLDGATIDVEVTATPLTWNNAPATQITLHSLSDRLAAEEAQARFAAIIQSSDDAIISTDLGGTITSWNPAAEKLFAYTAEEAIGKPISILTPEDRDDESPAIPAVRRSEKLEHFETKRKHKSGRLIDVSLSVSPIKDGSGKVVGVSKIARDISDRKEIEKDRQEFLAREQAARRAAESSEERYRTLAEALPLFVWVVQPDGQVEYCNSFWTQFTGLTTEQTRRNGWQAAMHPADAARAAADWRKATAGGQAFETEYRFRRAGDGAYRWFVTRIVPVRDAEAAISRWIGTGGDIHERRCAEEALRKSEARLRRLTESNIIGVVYADDQGTISYANEAFLQLTGYDRAELQAGRLRWRDMTPAEWRSRDEQGFSECAQRGACTPYEKEFLRKDGKRVRVLIGYALFDDPATEYISFVLDLTERKQLEEELRRQTEQLRDADRRKDEFLAILGHELRNPLAAILAGAQVLRLTAPATGSTVQTQEIIERQAAHMAHLIDDLLDVARITRGKILLRQQTLDLVELVRRTVEDHRAGIVAQQLALHVELPSRPLWVYGDATRLSQIIGNLLHNAQKFTPAGGSIFVSARATAEATAVEVSVRDTGIGIQPEMLKRIFEPFNQAERKIGAYQGGLGLGLALVHGLVALHGGEVFARSEGPDRGSEFTIRLPARKEARGGVGRETPEGQFQPRRIVLIEDNEDAAKSLQMLLKSAGHEVDVAGDAEQGLNKVEHLHPDVVLCDIGLPGGMDGYDVARAIRQKRNGAPYLIAITGFGQQEDQHRAFEAGFDLHLVKPVDLAALKEALCKLSK